MPRKQYIADLAHATASHGVDFIHDLCPGEDDGQFAFLFVHNSLNQPVSITAGITELSDYPNDHDYFIFAADNTPEDIANVLNSDLPSTHRKSIAQLLSIISNSLRKHVIPDDNEVAMPDSQTDDGASDDMEDEDEDFGYGYCSDEDDAFGANPNESTSNRVNNPHASAYCETTLASRNRIRDDLRAVKNAGFKFGCLRGVLDGHSCFVSVSVRIAKLGIGDAAMQAWQVEPSDYLILLLNYPSYKPKEELTCGRTSKSSVSMRVGLSKKYKPSLDEALAVFAVSEHNVPPKNTAAQSDGGFRPTFISKSLENLLNEQLISILEFRDIGLSRSGAESFYLDRRGSASMKNSSIPSTYFRPEPINATYPPIVNADHWNDSKNTTRLSFPLLAMQMLLKHFVRCTEFCVVCHKKLDSELEAIKPYVCDDSGLCLYQYVTMGFGPSFEHEIIAQPYVVDLLISFAYAQARAGRLSDFPHGLAMLVPKSFVYSIADSARYYDSQGNDRAGTTTASMLDEDKFAVKFDPQRREILFPTATNKCPVREGDWIAISQDNTHLDGPLHARVVDACYYPSVKLGPLINMARLGSKLKMEMTPITDPVEQSKISPEWHSAFVEKYDINFDELDNSSKRGVIKNLLDCLPSISDMKDYMNSQRSPDLSRWIDRISQPVLAILRWVVASNRACIMQVYDMDSATGRPVPKEDRVHGMKEWMSFRFAMGAPDKEKRFLRNVRETATRLNLSQHPTIFAWHGSSLQNWHSIIREGLHFKDTLNGRAYGHGVYHSLDLSTSLSYSGGVGYGSSPLAWPHSMLVVSTAMALNEIVNAPAEFTSRSPHLVVQHVDWIQTRYLFVKCSGEDVSTFDDEKPRQERPQDRTMVPKNSQGQPLVIPACSAIDKKRRISTAKSAAPQNKHKRIKGNGSVSDPMYINDDDTHFGDDGMSDTTDAEDLLILMEEDEEVAQVDVLPAAEAPSQTDFIPGHLNHDLLPKLPLPEFANTTATKRLIADFAALVKVQETTPLHELGWYTDPSKFDCPYQWIVELHSFHQFENKGEVLPIVKDLKKAGLKSVVLEMRFPGSYPMSPPFVRVIKPRFLSFMQGGGGHVTAGGAICMELLTNSGWSAVSSIESVLLQVRMAMASTEPKPARLENLQHGQHALYGVGEAISAYKRACVAHGWEVPPDFDKMAFGDRTGEY